MGYQESYIRMRDSKDFDRLVELIRKCGEDAFMMATPVEIITLLNPIQGDLSEQLIPDKEFSFDKGERFIYVIGERSHQRDPYTFFSLCGCNNCLPLDDYFLENLEIYPTECFPSYDIFKNNEIAHMATHEKFWVD